MSKCIECLKEPLNADEIGLNRKLRNKDVTAFYCIDCLSKKFNCSKESLLSVAQTLKKLGCGLFPKE